MHIPPEEIIRDEIANIMGDLYSLHELHNYEIFGDFRDTFYDLGNHIDERLGRRILMVAALARANDDIGGGLQHHATKRDLGVGLLREGKKETILTAREACNKIMHASSTRLVTRNITGHPMYQAQMDVDFPNLPKGTYIRAFLSTVGQRSPTKKWRAEIDLIPWVHAILHWLDQWTKRPDFDERSAAPAPRIRKIVNRRAPT